MRFMTKVQNLPPNAPKSPNSHILTRGPCKALRGPAGALGGNIVSPNPLPIKSARKNETFELSMGNTKIFLGVWRVVSMCPTLLNTSSINISNEMVWHTSEHRAIKVQFNKGTIKGG